MTTYFCAFPITETCVLQCSNSGKWKDVRVLAMDDVHAARPLMPLLLEYVLYSKQIKGARAAGFKAMLFARRRQLACCKWPGIDVAQQV